MLNDLRYALRMLLNSPGFAATAVLTLALGIGANTAIFSVVKAVLLRPLPFKNAGRLVTVHEDIKGRGTVPVSVPNFQDWQAENEVFDAMAAYSDGEFIVAGTEGVVAERIYGEPVTERYFEIAGVSAFLGRTFLPQENQVPMRDTVALIGYSLWQRHYGADPEIVGKKIVLNNAPFTIVGVLPKGFLGFSDQSEVWIPLMMRDATWPEVAKFDFLHNRGVHWLNCVAVLKSGVSAATAQAEMETIATRLAKEYPEENRERGAMVVPAQEEYTGSLRSPLYILLAAVGFVLLIACNNVANLVLVRAAGREREMAIRLALGAGRIRLIRQFMSESLVLSAAGSFAGILLADWGLKGLVAILPVTFPSFIQIHLDGGVFAFTLIVAFGVCVAIGLIPAWKAGRHNLNETLKEGAKCSVGMRGRRIGAFFVVTEVATGIVLLVGAGLLLKSFHRLVSVNTGFRPDHLLTMRFYVPPRYDEPHARDRFGPDLAERIARVPGVQSAAVTFMDPFLWGGFSRGLSLEGHPVLSRAEEESVTYQECGPNYFRTMEIPFLRGREFTMEDTLDTPRVVIVSETFARRFWPGENPIGKRLKYGTLDSENPWMQVVGIAGNIKFESLRQDPGSDAVLYAPLLQSEVIMNMSVIVRTGPQPETMVAPLRKAIEEIDSQIPVYNVATVNQRMREDSAQARSYTVLLVVFAFIALTLAAIGVYGVMAYTVSQQAHEIGIRLALGARPRGVFRFILGRGIRLSLVGVSLGLAESLIVMRMMSGMLYDVKPEDPLVLFVAATGLVSIALAACYLPARRAMHINPIMVLRHE
jgi:predicted permease